MNYVPDTWVRHSSSVRLPPVPIPHDRTLWDTEGLSQAPSDHKAWGHKAPKSWFVSIDAICLCTGELIDTNHVGFVCMPECVCHCVCAAPHDHNLVNNNRFKSSFTGIIVLILFMNTQQYSASMLSKCWELQYSDHSESRVFISGTIATAGEPRLGLNVWLILTVPSIQSPG